MFEKIVGRCELRDHDVEIVMIQLTKGKQKGSLTPVRCQNANECPRSSFCKFVNPLSARIPVAFGEPAKKNAEAS